MVAVLVLAGCDRVWGLEVRGSSDADTSDASEGCYGFGFLSVCTSIEDADIALRDTLDTTDDPRCREHRIGAGVGTPCVIAAERVTIPFPLRVIGSRPLVILASESITIRAALDASSRRDGSSGPGRRTDCASPSGSGTNLAAGGGAGGTFGFAGGPGGAASGAIAVAPRAVSPLVSFAGGCAGGDGGAVTGQSARARGGGGGGGVYLIAGASIDVRGNGSINASGAGGEGGGLGQGGAGGGAGGTIGFDAPAIVIEGHVIAKGGGGGGGGDGAAGSAGADADAANPSAQVSGGGGGGGGGNGGDGSNGTVGGVPVGTPMRAAGGGGGGGGRVLLHGQRTGAGVLNPAPS